MHRSVDSPLTDRLPTSCPHTYAQRCLAMILCDRLSTAPFFTTAIRPFHLKQLQFQLLCAKACGHLSFEKPIHLYMHHIPNDTRHYGILIMIGELYDHGILECAALEVLAGRRDTGGPADRLHGCLAIPVGKLCIACGSLYQAAWQRPWPI